MKKCFHSVSDCCFILRRDQLIPGGYLFFLALGVGLTEKFLALISFPFGSFEERNRAFLALYL
jgi:hypothetical protein